MNDDGGTLWSREEEKLDHLSVRLNQSKMQMPWKELKSTLQSTFFHLFKVSWCFLVAEKSIKMWVMLPVIFSIPGIVSNFERLSDKAPKPSVVGEAASWFSVTASNCSCFLFTTSFSVGSHSFSSCTCFRWDEHSLSFSCVNLPTHQHQLWQFSLSLTLLVLGLKQKHLWYQKNKKKTKTHFWYLLSVLSTC